MTQFWSQLAPREKQLIAIAGVLLAILILTLLVIRPALAYRTDGRQAYDDAVRTYVSVGRAAQVTGQAASADPSAIRSILTQTAQRSGIVINRINSQSDLIDMSIADVDATQLFSWLAFLEGQHGIVVRTGTVRPGGETGLVSARLTVASGG